MVYKPIESGLQSQSQLLVACDPLLLFNSDVIDHCSPELKTYMSHSLYARRVRISIAIATFCCDVPMLHFNSDAIHKGPTL